jgi:hypothetical protein
MFTGYGKIEIRNGIRIIADWDMIRYYQRLVEFATHRTERLQLPAHGAHITIVNPKIHKNVNLNLCRNIAGIKVEFVYYPEKMCKSPKNYWIPVDCEFAENLKKSLNVKETNNWLGFHLTVCNNKFNG